MPSRNVPFVNEEYYHVFNRGVAQIPIFNDKRDYSRFIKTFTYYQVQGPKPKFTEFNPQDNALNLNIKIVEIVCYCIMPNHFHFLLKQKAKEGITEFMSKLCNSYTKYFNTKNHRIGPLLQGEFKAVRIETNEQLLHLSRYIHLNPLVSYVTKNLGAYQWSSYQEYLRRTINNMCTKEIILNQFKSHKDYEQFIADQIDYGKQLEKIKHQLLDPQV